MPKLERGSVEYLREALREIAFTGTSQSPAMNAPEEGHYRRVAFDLIGIAARALDGKWAPDNEDDENDGFDPEVAPEGDHNSCGYMGCHFGSGPGRPDAACMGGYLWDLEVVDVDGGFGGGNIPCPQCNANGAVYAKADRDA